MKNDENKKNSSGASNRGASVRGVMIDLLTALAILAGGCTIDVEQPALEHPATASQTVQVCPAQYLLTTPVAEQCCYSSVLTNDNDGFTLFYKASSNQIVTRIHNPYGFACRASDGISACNGAECFYGPMGFSRPTYSDLPVTTAARFWTIFAASSGSSTSCEVAGPSDLPYDQTFINEFGISAPGQGCPGDDGGSSGGGNNKPASPWDY